MREDEKKPLITRVEQLLREQISELGENPAEISPHDYAAHMRCEVHADGSMVYIWREMPILRVVPEKTAEGVVRWRMFTQDDCALNSVQ